MLAQEGDYGKERLWGAVGWGVFSAVSGVVVHKYGIATAFYMNGVFAVIAFVPALCLPMSAIAAKADSSPPASSQPSPSAAAPAEGSDPRPLYQPPLLARLNDAAAVAAAEVAAGLSGNPTGAETPHQTPPERPPLEGSLLGGGSPSTPIQTPTPSNPRWLDPSDDPPVWSSQAARSAPGEISGWGLSEDYRPPAVREQHPGASDGGFVTPGCGNGGARSGRREPWEWPAAPVRGLESRHGSNGSLADGCSGSATGGGGGGCDADVHMLPVSTPAGCAFESDPHPAAHRGDEPNEPRKSPRRTWGRAQGEETEAAAARAFAAAAAGVMAEMKVQEGDALRAPGMPGTTGRGAKPGELPQLPGGVRRSGSRIDLIAHTSPGLTPILPGTSPVRRRHTFGGSAEYRPRSGVIRTPRSTSRSPIKPPPGWNDGRHFCLVGRDIFLVCCCASLLHCSCRDVKWDG